MGCIPPPKPTNQQVIDALFCLAPQFKTTDTETLACYNSIIDMLWCEVNWSVVSCCGLMLIAYLLAHTLTIRNTPGTGVTSNLTEGQLSIGYAVAAGGDILDATSYGKAYKDLIKRKVVGFTVSGLPPGFAIVQGPCNMC